MLTEKQFDEITKTIEERCFKISCSECPFEKPRKCPFIKIIKAICYMPITRPLGGDLRTIEKIEKIVEQYPESFKNLDNSNSNCD